MKIERNKSVDFIRAFAILMVLFYHVYAITNISFNNKIVMTFLEYGGVIGVCTFFVLSGFGIYNSFNKKEIMNEKFSYNLYIKKRFLRIAPQYYFSLIVMLLFTSSAVYISREHILTLISHIFFFHNFYYTMAGAISGVCWTLAVTFQFYLIAPAIYYIFKKYPKLVLLFSYLISFLLKVFVFHFIIAPSGETNTFLYFNYGSQIYTALEFFVSGMFVAYLLNKGQTKNVKSSNVLNMVASILGVVLLYFVVRMTYNMEIHKDIPYIVNTGIYSDCTLAYIWHALLSIVLSIEIYFFAKIKFNYKNILSKIILFISKYEYGIYIWHLIIISALSANSPFFQNLISYRSQLIYIYFMILSIIVGYIMTKIIDEFDYKKIDFDIIRKIVYILTLFLSFYCIYKTLYLIKPISKNVNDYINDDEVKTLDSEKIAINFMKNVNIEDKCSYIYLDTEETGYLYFFQLRYYLSPCESIHYNQYVYISNYGTKKELYNYLKKLDVKYIIIKDNPILSRELNIDFDNINGSIFKKNDKATDLKNILIPIEN